MVHQLPILGLQQRRVYVDDILDAPKELVLQIWGLQVT